MSKYIILTLLYLAGIQLGCSPKNEKHTGAGKKDSTGNFGKSRKKAKIKFISKLPAGESITFFYTDKFDDTHLFKIGGSKDSMQEISPPQPILLFSANNSQIPYLVYPTDTIIITRNKEKNDVQLAVKNDYKKTNDLNFFRSGENKIGKKYPLSIFKTLITSNTFLLASSHKPDFNMILKDALTKYKHQMEFLQAYSKKYHPGPYFTWFCKKYFYYNMILNELIPFIPEKYKPYDYPEYFLDTLYNYKSAFDCDSCLTILPYRITANYYVKFLSREDLGKNQAFSGMYKNITSHFSGETKNYLLFHLIKTRLRKEPDYYKIIKDKFLADCTNAAYKNYLNTNYSIFTSRNNSKGIKGTVLLDPEGNRVTWDSILKRNAGKVIYLDFWAGWCLPCRQEMPYSLKLHSAYAHKNIVFIYISLDKKRTNWMNAIHELGLPAESNYLLLKEGHSKLTEHLKIKTIPRYILINNNGAIIDLNAPRPGDRNIKRKIDLLLYQKNDV